MTTLLDSEKFRLTQGIHLVGVLPILRAAMSSGDVSTIRDTSEDFRSKLRVPIFDILDSKGVPLVNLAGRPLSLNWEGISSLTKSAMSGQFTQSLFAVGDRLLLLAGGPIGQAGDQVGTLVLGIELDNHFASRIQKLSDTDISFVAGNKIISSSLENSQRPSLIQFLSRSVDTKLGNGDQAKVFHDPIAGAFLIKSMPLLDMQNNVIGQMVIQSSPLKEAAAIRRELVILAALFNIFILVVAGCFGLLVANSLSKPIVELNRATENITKTHTLLKLAPVLGRDEIATLAESFNSLLERIYASQKTLENYNQNLELKVSEKTEQLEKSLNHLRAAQQKLVHFNRMSALGEMAGGIAHEINNPLAVIKANAALLKDLIHDPLQDKKMIGEVVSSIEETVERMAKIVRGLRSFARDGEQDPFIDTGVRAILDDTLALCHERFNDHQITLTISEIPESLLIECRPTQISQVLLNLLNNSFDAVQRLKEKWIQIDVQISENHVRLSVTDSGNGIPQEIQQKIMQPFFTTKEVGKGTGLGLSISTGMVQSHGGTLSYDSTHANTRFNLLLPRKQSLNGEQK